MKIFICFCLIFSLCGCQDQKNLLNLLFPSTIVIDYKDNQYEIALQIDNFNTLSKSELETSNENAKLLIATAKGTTIENAILTIEENQRSVVNLSHIKSIILKSNAVEEKILSQICNFISFHPEMRMDSEVYFTANSFNELFSTSFQLSRSQLYTLINSSEFQHVAMAMGTMNIMQLIKALDEKYISSHIPILKVSDNKDTYITQDGNQQQKIYEITELLYFQDGRKEKIALSDLQGIQWTKSHRNNVEINIVDKDGEIAAYSSKVSAFIYYHPVNQKYYLKGKVNLVVTRDSHYRSLAKLETILKEKVHEQIMHTYQIGLDKQIDVYNMRYLSTIYGQNTPLSTENFVNDLEVSIQIKGSYVGSHQE